MALKLAAVVLAAGASRRFGPANKLLADWSGKPIIAHVVETLAQSGVVDDLVIVTGFDAAAIRATVPGARSVENRAWEEGVGSSVALGVRTAEADGYLIVLGDMPWVSPTLIRSLRETWETDPERPVVPGRVTPPLILPRRLRAAAVALKGDSGMRTLLERESCASVDASESELRDLDLADD